MERGSRAPQSVTRLFVMFAAISLVPVVLLGAVLAESYRKEARRRGIAEGRSEAALVAAAAVEPLLSGQPLSTGMTPEESARLRQLADRVIREKTVLRLRLRDLAGRVVFSDDGSGFRDVPDGEAVDAGRGEVITLLTRLNADSNDTGPRGVAAVEAYRQLNAGTPKRPVGILEVYLPYAPIAHDVSAGLHSLYRNLAVGLGVLYLALFAICLLLSRGLRRELVRNVHLAQHDGLTDLPNRSLFQARAAIAVADAGRRREPVTIAIIDLDRFKEVNDTLGHHNGDRLLRQLADRLTEHIGPGDTVARLGGDEFGVILRGDARPAESLRRMRDVIGREAEVSGLPLSVEASIGYVVAPDDGVEVDDLLQRADVAMYVAKADHGAVTRYDPAHDHYDAANLGLIAELRHAINGGQLVLHYQPKTTLADGRVEAVEALVRWQHPTLGLLLPERFIPLAEQTDVIDQLTEWVVRQALIDLVAIDGPASPLAVAVNVSARNLGRPDFAHRVIDTLTEFDVDPARLIIEITETALLTDPTRAASILAELAAGGVCVSIDDFGRGHTSLGYLSELPVRELKIDKSFVSDMLRHPAHAAIVRSIIDLGHNLALRVVGEGVETDEVLRTLRDAGCDVAQGYLLARPMTVGQLTTWLADERQSCRPHSVLSRPDHLPERGSSPGATGLVHGMQPIER
jgi:diguanylate cyclase (GGDEF)-like protein